jgi:hypothetical protein
LFARAAKVLGIVSFPVGTGPDRPH